ncbi:DUF1972 domain-containing protein [Marinobacter arenosus]|uniref:DUF1972 domain-containing protein n=1 Tax=Marinobacter arenosus TaxID=2856822 RepID=UPI001C4CDA65|nr:DUF1972 domain-containing protein [Marinobacter arenosus]MBW0146819.1 DUF1972 domain-containing protein [Marinobacter arenosus]
MKKLYILGTRGIPARHGGFETFAEKLSLYLVNRGWQVFVYCQEDGDGQIYETIWSGVNCVHVPVKEGGVFGSVIFDWKASKHALNRTGIFLTLGYNTASFNILQRFGKQVNIINMDGIEWRREKWGSIAKLWFWLNERAGCWLGNHLVADHPGIKEHLSSRVRSDKITMIPYGGDEIGSADSDLLKAYELTAGGFSVIIARPEPENSLLEMVRAFSRKKRNHKLVVLGNLEQDSSSYHRSVLDAASEEVVFVGAIYQAPVVQALRFYCRFYLHGHRVGGTNPSLVEAMGAGCAIIAQDNQFNRWVAGEGAVYFEDEDSLDLLLRQLSNDSSRLSYMRRACKARFYECFTWTNVLAQYEELLLDWYPEETYCQSQH